MQQEIKHIPSSGNVFADLGLPNADALLEDADRKIEQRLQRDRQKSDSPSLLRRLLGAIAHPTRIHRRRRIT